MNVHIKDTQEIEKYKNEKSKKRIDGYYTGTGMSVKARRRVLEKAEK